MPGGGEFMNRNVSIVVVILVLVVIAGYLVWLRSKVTPVVSPQIEQQAQVTPTPTLVASPSATPKAKEATGSTKAKSATSSSTGK